MFNDKVTANDFEKMDPEYQDLLRRILTIQSDCEIGGPHLYDERQTVSLDGEKGILPPSPATTAAGSLAAKEPEKCRLVDRITGEMNNPG